MSRFGKHRTVKPTLTARIRSEAWKFRTFCPYRPASPLRADRSVPAGKVQEVLQICQEMGFERFVLRARQVPR